jgi:hypothetical protein
MLGYIYGTYKIMIFIKTNYYSLSSQENSANSYR